MPLTSCLIGAAFGAMMLFVHPLEGRVSDRVGKEAPDTTRSTADSSYTEEQAGRGEQVFSRVCLECHARSEMASADFRLKWGGQTTLDLFRNIVTTMPDSDPGSLPRADYEDVVAYILKLNGIPAGSAPLVSDSATMSRARLLLPPKSDTVAAAGVRTTRAARPIR